MMAEVPNLAEQKMIQVAREFEVAMKGLAMTGNDESMCQWASAIAAGMLAQIIFVANPQIPLTEEAVTKVKEDAVMIVEGVGLDYQKVLGSATRAYNDALAKLVAGDN
jgi:hypothetical protein